MWNHKTIAKLINKDNSFWDVMPCSLVEVDQSFRDTYYPHYQSDLSVGLQCTSTRLHDGTFPENCHLLTRGHENLKSHI
jgi:hypothetical protein